MKKVKFYFVFSLIVVFLSVIGILLGMVLVTIEQKHPEYLSAVSYTHLRAHET